MEVKIIKGAVGPDGVFKKGEIKVLPNEVAKQLIKDGIAVEVAKNTQERSEKADSTQAKKRNKR